jgi:hypothetical protein
VSGKFGDGRIRPDQRGREILFQSHGEVVCKLKRHH